MTTGVGTRASLATWRPLSVTIGGGLAVGMACYSMLWLLVPAAVAASVVAWLAREVARKRGLDLVRDVSLARRATEELRRETSAMYDELLTTQCNVASEEQRAAQLLTRLERAKAEADSRFVRAAADQALNEARLRRSLVRVRAQNRTLQKTVEVLATFVQWDVERAQGRDDVEPDTFVDPFICRAQSPRGESEAEDVDCGGGKQLVSPQDASVEDGEMHLCSNDLSTQGEEQVGQDVQSIAPVAATFSTTQVTDGKQCDLDSMMRNDIEPDAEALESLFTVLDGLEEEVLFQAAQCSPPTTSL